MTTVNTPGARIRQESTPLAQEQEREKPPLTRDSSVIKQVSNFIGISSGSNETGDNEEKAKWDKKRLRRIAQKYKLNENEVQKFVRDRSINQAVSVDSSTFPIGTTSSIIHTPGSPDDIERGIPPSAARVSMRAERQPVGPTPSLPNYESTSFESGRRPRSDSFSQTADITASQTRLSKYAPQRESVPATVLNSVQNFFKKGSFINKRKFQMHSSMTSKCSFDFDTVGGGSSSSQTGLETPDETRTPSSESTKEESGSPAGIIFKTPIGGESIEMKTFQKELPGRRGTSPKRTPPEGDAHLITSGIPEETSFEVELEEMGDVDEAQGVEMDPTAMSRMTARVRKKSSVRAPPHARDLSELSQLTTRSSPAVVPPLHRGKSAAPERPTNLEDGTRPFIHPSTSLPSRAPSFASQRKKKSRQEDQVLELLAEESEQKDREEGKDESERPSTSSFKPRFRKPHPLLAERSISLVDEVFFDDSQVMEAAGVQAPELSAYHPDIAPSPPTSAAIKQFGSPAVYQFDPASITIADTPMMTQTGVVRYHQKGNISYIDLGDSTLNRPKAVALGQSRPDPSFRPDRPFAEMDQPSTSSRRVLIRQPTVEDSEDGHHHHHLNKRQARKQEATWEFAKKIAIETSQSRQRGIGVFGKCFGRSYRKDLPSEVEKILMDGTDERPWFTYWVTTVQTVVCILSLLMYGSGPYGFAMRMEKGEVMDTTLSNRRVSYMEPENMWFGPRYSDLIRMGALYSPCMRKDRKLWAAIEEDHEKENKTGCCIANDHSGCYQSSAQICPRNVARWVRWDKPDPLSAKRNPLTKSKSDSDLLRNVNISVLPATWKQARRSGAVCGQDPSYCDSPSSVAPHEWPDDITKWPICEKRHEGAGLPEHLTCPVTGRPCCIQLQGLCRIATKEYCDFVRGHWHENATLCSQVDCFAGVCGMLPFLEKNSPNQFYRLFISLFIHAGVIHLAITVWFQLWLMKDLEQLIGSKRMVILYMVSGIGGNIASAIFVPFTPEVGPSGSQCGILAAIMVDCYHHRRLLDEFRSAIFQHMAVTLIVMLIGLAPWVDNWAHLFGFIFGLLTTIIVFPYLDFPDQEAPPSKIPTPLPSTPLQRGTSATIIQTAETPMMTATGGYCQLANGYSSPVSEHGNTLLSPMQIIWHIVRQSVKNRRTLYVIIAFVILVALFLVLAIIFFVNIEIDCPNCIIFNCIPILFSCDNQGQQLKKWLPI